MSKAGAWRFSAAIIFGSLLLTGTASAQSQMVVKDQAAQKQQSANQIVSADQKPLEPKPSAPANATPQEKAAEPHKAPEPQIEPELQNAVIPPPPNVIKRNTAVSSIMIPADKAGAKTSPEPKYEERPVVSSRISVGSTFGYRRDPFTRRAKFHSGVDIKARWGDAVGASQPGVVRFAGWYHGYGNLIVVDHGGGITTHYAHLSSFDVEVGAHVERGAIIGRAGSTGRATSPHLHYEVRVDGNAIHPFQVIALDASSDYFKHARPTVDAGRGDAAPAPAPPQNK